MRVQTKFGDATENWMNFQTGFKADETFKTTSAMSYNAMEDRKDPFKLKETALTKDAAALEQYRKEWTNGNHNLGRTYLGAAQFKKCQQD